MIRSVSHLEFLSYETEIELLSDVKPSNVGSVSHRAVNLRELVQDDTAVFETETECPLTTDKV